jgi:S1-C subfamily serine protease
LIGVNTAIFSPSGAYAGIGFAIPVDTVNRIVPQLIKHGRIIRPEIGMIPFRDQMARQLRRTGVLVRDIYPDSPASAAGLQPTQMVELSRGFVSSRRVRFGDLIVAADGEKIENLDHWYSFLERHNVGDRIKLKVIRDLSTPQQHELEIPITLAGPQD